MILWHTNRTKYIFTLLLLSHCRQRIKAKITPLFYLLETCIFLPSDTASWHKVNFCLSLENFRQYYRVGHLLGKSYVCQSDWGSRDCSNILLLTLQFTSTRLNFTSTTVKMCFCMSGLQGWGQCNRLFLIARQQNRASNQKQKTKVSFHTLPFQVTGIEHRLLKTTFIKALFGFLTVSWEHSVSGAVWLSNRTMQAQFFVLRIMNILNYKISKRSNASSA